MPTLSIRLSFGFIGFYLCFSLVRVFFKGEFLGALDFVMVLGFANSTGAIWTASRQPGLDSMDWLKSMSWWHCVFWGAWLGGGISWLLFAESRV